MNYPSIKRIETILGLSREDAKRLRALIDGTANPEDNPAVQRWRAQCYHWPPRPSEMILEAANDLLGGFGVEAIRGEWVDSYHCDVGLSYVNMGDTYAATLIHDNDTGRWIVGDWGSVVESNPKRFENS